MNILIVSASIGAGHDGTAAEIARNLRLARVGVERADYLDLLPAGWGKAIKQTYARQLAYAPASWGWLLDRMGGPSTSRGAAWLATRAAQQRLLEAAGPDTAAVVSTYPLASQALGRLRLSGQLHVPAVAVLTDPSVHPLCVADGVDLHLAPNDEAATVVREVFGRPAATNAPIVSPAFRPSLDAAEVLAARRRHGLPVDDRLALVVAGSWGVGEVAATIRDLVTVGAAMPVVVCGRNTALRRRLAATGRVITLGWVDDMPSLLRAADVLVTNGGSLTSLEALATSRPVLSYRCLPGHGVANAAVLERLGLAAWPRTVKQLAFDLHSAFARRPVTGWQVLTAAPAAGDIVRSVARIAAVMA